MPECASAGYPPSERAHDRGLVLPWRSPCCGPAGAQDAPTPNPIEIGDVDSPLGDIIPRAQLGRGTH